MTTVERRVRERTLARRRVPRLGRQAAACSVRHGARPAPGVACASAITAASAACTASDSHPPVNRSSTNTSSQRSRNPDRKPRRRVVAGRRPALAELCRHCAVLILGAVLLCSAAAPRGDVLHANKEAIDAKKRVGPYRF
jgi:hypothetical protein